MHKNGTVIDKVEVAKYYMRRILLEEQSKDLKIADITTLRFFRVETNDVSSMASDRRYLYGPHGVSRRALIETGFDRSPDGVKSQRGGGERGVIRGVARGRRVPRESLDACRVAAAN